MREHSQRAEQHHRADMTSEEEGVLAYLAMLADAQGVAVLSLRGLARGTGLEIGETEDAVVRLIAHNEIFRLLRAGDVDAWVFLVGEANPAARLAELLTRRFRLPPGRIRQMVSDWQQKDGEQ